MFNTTERLAFGDFLFDLATSDLYRGSRLVPLTPKALSLLGYLVSRPGRLLKKHELLDAIWPDVFVSDGVLKVCVREIRRALGDDAQAPQFIQTAHRRGYRFIAPVRELDAPLDTTALRILGDRTDAAIDGIHIGRPPRPDHRYLRAF